KNKLKIFKNKKNYGIGGSHKIVFNYLIENEFDYCLIIPSSYKGSPNEILKLFCTYQHNNPEVDVFFGKRIFKSHLDLNAKIVQRMSRNVAEPLKHLLSDYKFSDIGSRFILIRVEVLKDLAFKSLSDGSEFNLQLNVLLTEVPDLKIREIELKKWAFSNTDSAKILRYSGKMIKTMTHYGVNKYLFQRSGWRLFNDFPDNIEREFEII
ncbi:MAG: hypothetical protein KDD58_10190, partial [Bdellovibrionales bacterium]|nr:hypothetical protein [Bdellovibrionales bacterium]